MHQLLQEQAHPIPAAEFLRLQQELERKDDLVAGATPRALASRDRRIERLQQAATDTGR